MAMADPGSAGMGAPVVGAEIVRAHERIAVEVLREQARSHGRKVYLLKPGL
jgi:hypothetical protein